MPPATRSTSARAAQGALDQHPDQSGGGLALSALRVVLGVKELNVVDANKVALAEAKLAAPALFAKRGDLLTHRLDTRMDELEHELFEYLGRADGGGAGASCSDKLCCPRGGRGVGYDGAGCGEGPHRSPAGWLCFRHLDGPAAGGMGGSSQYPGPGGHLARNCGFRHVIQAGAYGGCAWLYNLYEDDGSFDPDVICLPPEKVYCFRPAMEHCSGCGEDHKMYLHDGSDGRPYTWSGVRQCEECGEGACPAPGCKSLVECEACGEAVCLGCKSKWDFKCGCERAHAPGCECARCLSAH